MSDGAERLCQRARGGDTAAAAELEALRAENQRLVAQGKDLAGRRNRTPLTQLPDFVAKAALHDAGLATPEAAVQTFLWSASQGDINRLRQCVLPGTKMVPEGMDAEAMGKELMDSTKDLEGFRITERKDVSPDEVLLGVSVVGMTGPSKEETQPMPLKRVGNEWKVGFDQK